MKVSHCVTLRDWLFLDFLISGGSSSFFSVGSEAPLIACRLPRTEKLSKKWARRWSRYFGQKSMFSKAQKRGSKKKNEASLNFCLWTVKRPLKSVVMSVLPNSWPIKYVSTFYAQNSCFWVFLCLNE